MTKLKIIIGFIMLLFMPTSALFSQNEQDEIFEMVEEMPRFPGCEDRVLKQEKESCSNQKLMEFIYSNLKYPPLAIENGVEGKVIVRFVVRKDGSITKVEILRDIGGECGKVVKRVLESMNKMSSKWIPGMQGGRKVDVYFTLPVNFKLNDDSVKKKTTENKIIYFKLANDTIFLVNDQLPIFPGATMKPDYINYYNNFKLQELINAKLRIPEEIFMKNIPGEILVQFMVTKKGEIKDIKILKDLGHRSGEEAVRLIESMNDLPEKWKPARYGKKKIDSYIRYNIKFPIPSERIKMSPFPGSNLNSNKSGTEEIFVMCEDPPVFPGCNDIGNKYEKEQCSYRIMADYIQSKLVYPLEAKSMGLEGKVTLRFVVYSDGKVGNVEILNDIGGGCGESAKKAIESMNNMPEKWIPGKQGGRKISAYIKAAAIFKL